MLAQNSPSVSTSRHARNIASAYYLLNPRVTLIDVGWYVDPHTGISVKGDLRVRVHLRQQPRNRAFEAFATRNPKLMIDKDKIPFPVDLVEASYRLHWNGLVSPPDSHGQVFAPLCGGISISNEWSSGYGTLGGIVVDVATGDEMILSNWHVLAGYAYAEKGLRIYQPGFGDGGRLEHTVASYRRDAMLQGIDAAVAGLSRVRPWTRDQLEIGRVQGISPPQIDMHVIKSGRGSHVTEGIVDGFDGEFPMWYGGLPHVIKNVWRIVPREGQGEVSRPGDSGSWWLENETRKAVGLHFGGTDYPFEMALAIGMPEVLSSLNATIPD